jgi:hypothetical protein
MLRVGIMLDSYTSNAWVAKVIEEIQSSGFARAELVILISDSPRESSLLRNFQFALFRLFERWDYQRNKSDHDAMAPVDVSSLLNGIALISVEANYSFTDGISENSEDRLTEIGKHELDVIFHFGSSIPPKGILTASRYGVWSFHHGCTSERGGGAPFFEEFAKGNPVSESSLLMFTDSLEHGRVVYKSYASTDQVSLYVNRNPIYWKTAEFALRGLRELYTGGAAFIQSLPTYREGEKSSRRSSEPTNLRMIFFTRRYLSLWLQARRTMMRSGPRAKWFIALRKRGAGLRFDDPAGYSLMPCPTDRFYADPFLFEKDGRTFLFFEDFRYAENRAVISCCELGPDGTPGSPVEVLRCPFHLSYPFVFEHAGEIYMIPETKENRMVELYRATSFPTGWVSEAVLLNDVYAVDATVQEIDGRFWMFAGVSNGNFSNCDELCLFFADELTGPWTPHAANPVLSDVRRSRPAGRLFYDEGRLIRPSQDCGKAYGYALLFSEVLTLNETEYEERQISRLEPGVVAGCSHTHTYNRTEQFEVVDRTLAGR